MNGKRGSHVGMIISFVVFITFIIFLYTVIRPAITSGEDKRTVLNYIEEKIEKNVSSNFTQITLMMYDDPENPEVYTATCVRFEQFLFILQIMPSLIVKNETGDIQEAYHIERFFSDFEIKRANINNVFFKVYYSPEFDDLSDTGLECELARYNIAYKVTSVDTDEYIFEENVYDLMDYYKNNYEALKTELSIPGGNEFEFGFIQSNGTRMWVGNASKTSNVYATETPVQYIDNKANMLSGYITVKVW